MAPSVKRGRTDTISPSPTDTAASAPAAPAADQNEIEQVKASLAELQQQMVGLKQHVTTSAQQFTTMDQWITQCTTEVGQALQRVQSETSYKFDAIMAMLHTCKRMKFCCLMCCLGFGQNGTLCVRVTFQIEVRSHWKLLNRVGEAKNPGPDLTFLCANITSLRMRWPSIQDQWQANVYLWQEVRLGLDGQNIMAAQLREHGLHAQWSAPQPTVRPKAAPGRRRPRVTPWSVKQGAQQLLLVRRFLLKLITHATLYAASCGKHNGGQLRRSLLEMANSTFMPVVPMQRREPATLGNLSAEKFTEAVSLGDQPVVLSLDANLSRERSATLNALFTSGRWIDVAYEVAGDRDQLQGAPWLGAVWRHAY